jgi:phosphatidylserine decarboxylase
VKDALIVSLLSVTPRKRGARTMGWLARRRASRLAVRWFVRRYKVDLSEASGELRAYPTLEALFTRELVSGARPVDDAPGAMVSPVDGRVAWVGATTDGRVPVATDRFLTVADLLGEPVDGERDIAVLYLSPTDYHRVHVPREGTATRWRYRPGTLWPVFPGAVKRVRGLFSGNERVAVHVETDAGPVEVVLIGAFGVGRITLQICDIITNAKRRPAPREGACKVEVLRGEELGVFHLGSTVVLVTEPGAWEWSIGVGDRVRVGRTIAQKVNVG